MSFKIYVTEALRVITENTTHHVVYGVGDVETGRVLKAGWYESIKEQKEPEPEMDADDIAMDVILRAGLKFTGEDENG